MYKQNWCSTSQQRLKFLKVLAEIAAISHSECPIKIKKINACPIKHNISWFLWKPVQGGIFEHQPQCATNDNHSFCNNSACKTGKINYPEKYSTVNETKLHKHKSTIVKKEEKETKPAKCSTLTWDFWHQQSRSLHPVCHMLFVCQTKTDCS